MLHFLRVGVLGQVGRFRATDGRRYARGARVICRTVRGLEVGTVLTATEEEDFDGRAADGELLRRATVQDDLLIDRLEKHRAGALAACAEKIAERQLPVILLDVEHLFDGASLYFYFLGETTPELDALTDELAALYDTRVQFRQFAETLAAGCGPDCGTKESCGEGSCSTCALVSGCGGK